MIPKPPALLTAEASWALAPYAGAVGARVARAKRQGDREGLRALGVQLARGAHDVVAGGWLVAQPAVTSNTVRTKTLRRDLIDMGSELLWRYRCTALPS